MPPKPRTQACLFNCFQYNNSTYTLDTSIKEVEKNVLKFESDDFIENWKHVKMMNTLLLRKMKIKIF